jgi:general secretion pathway protein H
LVELMIVIGVIGLLAAAASPYFFRLVNNARYREAARNIASSLRKARGEAITRNQACQVELDIANRSYTTTVVASGDVLFVGPTLHGDVVLRTGAACAGNADVNIVFEPNGTSSSANFICIMQDGTPPVRRYRVGVSSETTGRVVID